MATGQTTCTRLPDMDEWPLSAFLAFGPLPMSAQTSRLWARVVLAEWRMSVLTACVEQIVTELVSNAIKASRQLEGMPPVQLWLMSDRRRVLIVVQDASQEPPVPQHPDADDVGGRGLMLVAAISAKWDCYFLPDGKIIWAMCEA
jgi:hypothetical protein